MQYLHLGAVIVVGVVEDARRHRGVGAVNVIALDYDGAAEVLQNKVGEGGVFICQAANVGGRTVHSFPPDDAGYGSSSTFCFVSVFALGVSLCTSPLTRRKGNMSAKPGT